MGGREIPWEGTTATGVLLDDVDDLVRRFSVWIDSRTPLTPDAQSWHRVTKVAEEAGEVVGAMLGYTGANPRKGHTHDLDALDAELMQTAISALGASAHLHGNDPGYSPVWRLIEQLYRDTRRAGIEPEEDD